MSIDWLILAFPIAGIIALLWARHTSKQMRLREAQLEEQIRQRDNARVIGQARSMAAMLSNEDERGQLLARIELVEKMVEEKQAHLF